MSSAGSGRALLDASQPQSRSRCRSHVNGTFHIETLTQAAQTVKAKLIGTHAED